MSTFEIKNTDKFIEYLKEAFELKKDGLKDEEKFHDICYILTGLIKNGIKNSVNLKRMIHSIIFNMDKYDSEIFLDQLQNRMYGGEIEKYYFVATMNLDLNSLKNREYTLDKLKIYLKDYNEIEKEFKISQLFEKWNINRPQQISEFLRYSYAVIEIEDNNASNAFEKGYDYFELFRGIINFAENFKTLRHIYYGCIPEPKTLSLLQPSKFLIIFGKDKEFVFDRFNIGFFDYSINRFSSFRLEFLDNIIDKINSLNDNSLRKRCLSTFKKYNNGLDGNVAGTSFLEFWKIFELVALSDTVERGMAESKVAKRISSIIKNRTEFSQDLMDTLCDKRNYMAHIGSLPEFDLDELNLIRKYCEVSMMFLLNVVEIYKDETTLDYFYDNINRNEKDIERLEKVISEIKRLRNE